MSDQAVLFEDQSHLEVVYVLLLLQGAMGLLSGTAMLIFMAGSPLAWPLALGVPLILFLLAVGVARSNRWARRVAYATEVVVLLAFAASALLGFLREVDMSFSLMTLITNLLLPVAVITLLRRRSRTPPETATAPAVAFEPETERGEQAWAR